MHEIDSGGWRIPTIRDSRLSIKSGCSIKSNSLISCRPTLKEGVMERFKRRVIFVSLATVLVLSLALFGCGLLDVFSFA